MRWRGGLVGWSLIAVIVVVAIGCGDSRAPQEAIALEEFVAEFGQAYCHRIYGCCHAADVWVVSPGKDEATCAAEMTTNARNNARLLLAFRGIIFDPERAAHCLEVLHADQCTSIFDPVVGELIACQDIFPGSLDMGAGCEDDHECVSHRCAGGRCSATPPPVCETAEFLDESHNVCVARHALGEPCSVVNECGVGETCVGAVCAKRLPDGASCEVLQECTGTCATLTDGSGKSACRPGYCRGR
jgi:hypothetical protein